MLTLSHLRILAVRTVKEFGDDNCSQMAAAISYYVLFSLFPLLIFSVGVLGVLLQDSKLQEDLVEVVLDYIPLSEDEGQNDVQAAVRDIAGAGSGAIGVLGLIGMAWSGSNLFGVIRRSVNLAYDLDVHRPIVRQKLLDLGLVAAFTPLVIASLAGTAAIRFVRESSEDVPVLSDASQTLGLVWDVLPLLVPAAISFVAFVALYWIVPATRVKVRDVVFGAALGGGPLRGGEGGLHGLPGELQQLQRRLRLARRRRRLPVLGVHQRQHHAARRRGRLRVPARHARRVRRAAGQGPEAAPNPGAARPRVRDRPRLAPARAGGGAQAAGGRGGGVEIRC